MPLISCDFGKFWCKENSSLRKERMEFLSYHYIFRAIWNKRPYEGCPQQFIEVQQNSTYPDAGYPDRPGPSENLPLTLQN
jgi:hypothetical protein